MKNQFFLKTMMRSVFLCLFSLVCLSADLMAAGTLKPNDHGAKDILILNHHLDVVINNGFVRSEVTQTFHNPNTKALEAIYTFPLPKQASLSEVAYTMNEISIQGEVVEKGKAEKIYKEEKEKGNDSGLAKKNAYKNFEFRISSIQAQSNVEVKLVYYQPIDIDTSVGKFVYPLEEGGTDEAAKSFWTRNDKVENSFSAKIELKSSWPVDDVRLTNWASEAQTKKIAEGHYVVELNAGAQSLNKDLVFYYRLKENLPGRVEMMAYKPDANKSGTFMCVVTPGLDLKKINQGADYIFVLDQSGSMRSKLHTLSEGIAKTLGQMHAQDRFKIISFNDRAHLLTNGFMSATPENVKRGIELVQSIKSTGGTNVYAGLKLALDKIDDDRVSSVVLVTDGVTNTGIVDPKAFHTLMKKNDIRVFGFLMGNSGNWPLMRVVCQASGGFYSAVSNSDDIIGEILKAKGKIIYESLHDAEFKLSGIRSSELTGLNRGKIYRGQQLILFGKYHEAGEAELALHARLSGEDKTYKTSFRFPAQDIEHPEIERLFALSRIEEIEDLMNAGLYHQEEGKNEIRDLGLQYQIVTDETSMLILDDDGFKHHQIERKNLERTRIERMAKSQRSQALIRSHRVDQAKPMTNHSAPSINSGGGSGGGGNLGWLLASFAILSAWTLRRQQKRQG